MKAIGIPNRRGYLFVYADVIEAGDADIDIGAPQHIRRIDPIVDVDAAARAKEMMRDRIASSIFGRIAGGAQGMRFRPREPEPRLGAIAAIALGRSRGEIKVDLEA